MNALLPSPLRDLPAELCVPAWVHVLLGRATCVPHVCDIENVAIACSHGNGFGLVSARLAHARDLGRVELGERVYRMYRQISQIVSGGQTPHPVRFWNHICHIHEQMGEAMDRYMAFNVGRFRAFEDWFGGSANFDRCVATASGVGCLGEDIVIHVLCCDREGIAISNPRQVQPFRYSLRYGPRPPCFARATALPQGDGRAMLLVGGTASIRGEESLHLGDLDGQLQETLENVATLVSNAGRVLGREATLANFTDLRIYLVDPTNAAKIEAACRHAMPNVQDIQTQRADICRRELLVEIEGRAVI